MENKRQIKKRNNVVSFIPNGDYYYQKALTALERDQTDKAYKYIKRAAELSPDDGLILMQYGVLEMELQNFEHAYELIHSAYHLDQNEPEIVFMLAEVSGCVGMIHDAQKYALKYLEMEPEGMYSVEAQEILDFVEFEKDVLENLDESDSEKMVGQEKARRLMENGDFNKAIEVLEELIERFPDAWAAYNNLSLAYFYIGEAEEARALLRHVLRENHGNLHALCNLAVFAYYEKNEEELSSLLAILAKIQPYEWDNRYKLGATLALIGQYEQAYKWLRSMSKRGYEGDPGFYFWLAQSAYFSGHEEAAKQAWAYLVKMDPTKEGFEPWQDGAGKSTSLENSREIIIDKINSRFTSDRLFGFFLLKRSAHKQEIIAHPKWIDVANYNEVEKLCLAYALGHEFSKNAKGQLSILRGMEVAEVVAEKYGVIQHESAHVLQLWFALFELAVQADYPFRNVKALAASVDYMFHSAMDEKVTKKQFTEKYGISAATLTKYSDELVDFVPTDV
ncbi:tetratricopeptide repeat protein [Lysinibacillus odysseyi]|uniref:Transcriptional regulator n=1 Tax=Lysinibacillus odysseyi 34hs-1 = NBRC 100172 TaxID=1220589 RepID=A0A0A3IDP6_9BACI|nr:tetratricopeptide repeat protein [Lysinibacillus odysseyi]KGR82824.1 transcriptional regulator [Lysinibacillus odysseyi 34hs-1 = NBRC 100172]